MGRLISGFEAALHLSHLGIASVVLEQLEQQCIRDIMQQLPFMQKTEYIMKAH